ncbi:tRNA-specific 2-thiouridylase MnmA [Alphaproteobacteria bacterium]|nr:tRNA-specific 2-thiouridylase MnmA [Alphaproteobacteria bacterium]
MISRGRLKYGVGMSGGVDSSVTASLLLQNGFDVFGVTMNIHDACEYPINEAKIVCQKLGIEHFVFDAKEAFSKSVIQTFIDSYAIGLTPNPCAICNRDIKMNLLFEFIMSKGADIMATGHYANICVDDDVVFLKEAADKKKDQSYFLSLVPRKNLRNIRFPLGEIESKSETRRIAESIGLHNSKKKDSQDICFLQGKNYKEFIKNSQEFACGNIVLDETNEILGQHSGLFNYTTGQRRGLGISHNNPLYVVKLAHETNEVIVGARQRVAVNEFNALSMNWIMDAEDEFVATVKLRSICQKTKAKITKLSENLAKINLLELQTSPVTNGQICCIYDNLGRVIGAGVISY